MFWDDLVRRWRREAKIISPQLLRAAGGHVAVLPAPRRRRRSRLTLLLVLLVAIGAALLVGSGRLPIADGDAVPSLVAAELRDDDA